MKNRVQYFDMAKGLGIILVVLGHIEYISEELRAWISSFHMALFFMIAGMLIHYLNETELNFKELAQKKFRGILIPYFWFSLIYTVIDVLNLCLHKIDLLTFYKNILHSITFYGSSVLWFLPALFLAELFFLFLSKRLSGMVTAIIIAASAILSYFLQIYISQFYTLYENSLLITTCIDFIRVFLRASIASVFVCIAYNLFYLLKKRTTFSGIELAIGIVLFLVNAVLSQINGCVDFHYIILENQFLFYLCAVIGSLSIILICKNCRFVFPLNFFGKNSLLIMCTHVNCYLLYAAILIAWQIDTIVTRAKSYIFNFNIMIFTFLFETILIFIVNRYFPFILGRKKIKKEVSYDNK
ncbi:MAG: acyltransferase family protein [Clostridia bacterium]|nr:acyltransferase family protein [Clostridia bacterium]